MSQGYWVESAHGCKIIVGAIPVDDFVALTEAWAKHAQDSDKWIADSRLAESLEAGFVLGPLSACLAWRAERGIG